MMYRKSCLDKACARVVRGVVRVGYAEGCAGLCGGCAGRPVPRPVCCSKVPRSPHFTRELNSCRHDWCSKP